MTTIEMSMRIEKIVIDEFNQEQVGYVRKEIDTKDLPKWLDKYGSIVSPDGASCRLIGVRLEGFDRISYAGCYWYTNPDHTWKRWSLYVGCSHAPGLIVSRD